MDGHTALHLAALHGNAPTVHMLLEAAVSQGAGVAVGLACTVDHAGNTPLHLAALKGHHEAAEQLLAAPEGCAAIDVANHAGMSVFYVAAMHGHYTVAALVLRHSIQHSSATASTPGSSVLAALPECRKTKLLKLLGRCERPTLLGLLSWKAGSCAAVRLRDPQPKQTGPMVNLMAQFMALGHFTGGNAKQSDLGQAALDLLQQQVQLSMGLTLCKADPKEGSGQGDTLQLLLRTGITCKVLDIANGEHGFGHFPYEIEVTMQPCLEQLRDGTGAVVSSPAVSSSASPFDQTMMSTVAVGAAVQAGRNPNITVRRDTASTRAVKASHTHWEERPHDNGRLWKLTSWRSEPINHVRMEDFLRHTAKRSCLPSFMRRSGVPMTVPGFQLDDDHQSGVPSLRLDFLSSDHPGSFDWTLPIEVPAARVEWKVTAAVRTAFLGAGKLQGFWETREFKASTIVKPVPDSSAPDSTYDARRPSNGPMTPSGRPAAAEALISEQAP
ncbi:hypothetical protein WJX74_003642 [Apatococcus lobatus]|uniref:Uncharacterized protein n=1 Tax=Apatococcus lobatus TaxID=904363 RepID=A0AAW1RZH1_9CHLO